MSSEERRRREEEPPRESPTGDEETQQEQQNAGEQEVEYLTEPVEVGEPGVVSETADEGLSAPSGEFVEEAPFEEVLSEESLEITQDELSVLADELELARRERDEYLDSMRRMKAEMENSRKRQERERARTVQLASEKLVRELLPVVDNLERALEAEGDIHEGVRATRDQLLAALEREGLVPLVSDGESFDPAVHEAVMGQPSDEHEEDTVIQTLERGYVLNGRPIRPAKVIVAR
ncbi:MAG: nucleotide exchange factor GrpE [Rubrobacter sp.]|nr:nucleotide exchange factor GrpE [Rubrobacter sp.]